MVTVGEVLILILLVLIAVAAWNMHPILGLIVTFGVILRAAV